jgi:hypothetical protein
MKNLSKEENKMKRSEVTELNAVLSKCAIKSVGSDLFLPIVKIKAEASKVLADADAILKIAGKDIGIDLESNKSVSEKIYLDFMILKNKINAEEVKFSNVRILTAEKFSSFSDENPKLTTAELEIIFSLMVISE